MADFHRLTRLFIWFALGLFLGGFSVFSYAQMVPSYQKTSRPNQQYKSDSVYSGSAEGACQASPGLVSWQTSFPGFAYTRIGSWSNLVNGVPSIGASFRPCYGSKPSATEYVYSNALWVADACPAGTQIDPSDTSGATCISTTLSCPANSTLNGGSCTCNANYTQQNGTCVANSCPAANSQSSTGFFAIGTDPNGQVPPVGCNNGCTTWFSPAQGCPSMGYACTSGLQNGKTTYYTQGTYYYSGGANATCSTGSGSGQTPAQPSSPTPTKPPASCAPDQLPVTVNGKLTCYQNNGTPANTNAAPPPTPKTTSTSTTTNTTDPTTGNRTETTQTTNPQTGETTTVTKVYPPGSTVPSSSTTTTTPGTSSGSGPGGLTPPAPGSPTSPTGSSGGSGSGTPPYTPQPGTADPPASFCQDNPKSPLCATSSFDGKCGQFVCDGDAVQCATAKASWEMLCNQKKLTEETNVFSSLITDPGGSQALLNDAEKALNLDGKGDFDMVKAWNTNQKAYFTFTGSCPQSPQVTLPGGHVVTFTTDYICQIGQFVRLLVHLISYMLVLRLLYRTAQ